MSWFLIALGAPFLWALVNISDQYFVSTYSTGERTSGGLVLFGGFLAIIIAGIIWLFTAGVFSVSVVDALLLVGVGGITIVWVILYLFSLEIEDISIVASWFLIIPIFSYLLGYLFLGETFSVRQLLGAAIILCGVSFILVDFSSQRKKLKWKSSLYMFFACFLIAIAGALFKYVTVGSNFWVSSFWEYVGFGLFGILVYCFVPKYRREFIAMNQKGGKKIFLLSIVIELLTIGGNLLNNFAVLLAPLAMVYLVGSFQPAIVFLLMLFMTKFFPGIAKENMSRKVVIPKIIAMGVMILGSAILFT